jgi:beta-mannosidase
MDFRGAVLKTIQQPLTLRANSSAIAFTAPIADLLGSSAPEGVLMQASLTAGSDVLAEDVLYFRPVKDLALTQASVSTTVKSLGDAFAIGLSSPVLVKNLYLSFENVDGVFSDNYFDLLPGRPTVIHFKPAGATSAKTLESSLHLMHMALVV